MKKPVRFIRLHYRRLQRKCAHLHWKYWTQERSYFPDGTHGHMLVFHARRCIVRCDDTNTFLMQDPNIIAQTLARFKRQGYKFLIT